MRKLAKPTVFVLALVPLAVLIFLVLTGRTSANPAEDILLTTGIWALRFLLATLAITPLRRLTGWNVLIQYRRMLGLFAFFYGTVHLTSYIAFDRFFAFDEILADIAKRPFITAGMAAFVLMLPLAVTSTKGWIRRLGRRWQMLHRIAKVVLGCDRCFGQLWHLGHRQALCCGPVLPDAGCRRVREGQRAENLLVKLPVWLPPP